MSGRGARAGPGRAPPLRAARLRTLRMGSMQNWTKARTAPSSAVFCHFLPAALKKLSPQSFAIILSSSIPNFLAYLERRGNWFEKGRRRTPGERGQSSIAPPARPASPRPSPSSAPHMRENLVSVKAQPCSPAEKETVPLAGSTWISPIASST